MSIQERDARSETITLLEQFIEENDNQSGNDELNNEEDADTRAEFGRWAIETGEDIDASLAERHDDRQYCCRLVSFPRLSRPQSTYISARSGTVHDRPSGSYRCRACVCQPGAIIKNGKYPCAQMS